MNKNERAQVEAVFNLGGGELETTPWENGDEVVTYWYTGAPEYARDNMEKYEWAEDGHHELRTAILDCSHTEIPQVGDVQNGWKLIAAFDSSGETECPIDGDGCDEVAVLLRTARHAAAETYRSHIVNKVSHNHPGWEDPAWDNPNKCPLCEDDGIIYIGDGWYELVYQKVEVDE